MKNIFLILSCILFSAGCTSYRPMLATENSLKGNKMGTSCLSWLLSSSLPFSWGRNDIMTAANNGNIEKISVVDSSKNWYLLYGETCTHVYGN